jgi:hypothetical protein
VLAADPRAALDDVRAEITTAIRTALRNTDTRARAGLTGGKDSRLVLALLLSSDCASDVDFQTLGNDDLPDVAIAGRLASTLGLRHLTNPRTRDRVAWRERLNEALGSGHGTPREIAFRITAAVTSGTRSVGEPHLGRLAPPNCLLLSGLCGETIRTNYPATIELRSKEHASRFPYQFGKAGILDAEVLAHYRSEIHEILFEGITEHDSPQDVIDAYYLRQRLRRWAGITMEVDPDARMFPLYSTTAIQLAFGIGAENRHAEWIHYQLMRDAFEPLVHVPFANGSWAPGASKDLVAPATYTDPVPAAPPPPRPARRSVRKKTPALRTVNRERRAKERATDLAIMRNLFRPDSANPAFELIDRRGVQRALDNFDELPDGQRLQLYGALTAVIWLGGHELALPRELAVP